MILKVPYEKWEAEKCYFCGKYDGIFEEDDLDSLTMGCAHCNILWVEQIDEDFVVIVEKRTK
jgi:hypothetical protein